MLNKNYAKENGDTNTFCAPPKFPIHKYIFYGCTAESVLRHIVSCIDLNQSINNQSTNALLVECGAVAFADSAKELWGTTYFGLPVISPAQLAHKEFDKIVVAGLAVDSIIADLTEKYGILTDQIIDEPAKLSLFMREKYVRTIAPMMYKRGIAGSVAECGVWRGNFASVINQSFPDRKIYLFDTFEGFLDRDVISDNTALQSGNKHSYFAETSIETVLGKLPFPENAVIKQGWFPDTTAGVEDMFAFVSLDFDLYSPIKAGLEWFYPRMSKGGIILVHDYFHSNYDCYKAVDEFCNVNSIYPTPIGDVLSVAIIKQ